MNSSGNSVYSHPCYVTVVKLNRPGFTGDGIV